MAALHLPCRLKIHNSALEVKQINNDDNSSAGLWLNELTSKFLKDFKGVTWV
jgi:hypothetical protein